MSPRLPSQAGFLIRRTSGSHYLLQHRGNPALQVVVPYHAAEIKRGLLHGIIKQAGMTAEEFLKLL